MNENLSGWRKVALKRRVRFAYGDSLASEDRNDGDVPVFGSNGIVGAHDTSITTSPTIVIGRKGSSGKVVWSDVPCFPIDTTFFVDRTQTREDMRWLFYTLESLGLDKINFDSAVPGLSRKLAYSLPLFSPPLPVQQRIAAYLHGCCVAIDSAVAAKRGQLKTLDALRRSIIQRAVTRGIVEGVSLEATGSTWMEQVPRGWKLVCLKRVAEIQGGLTLGKQYEGELVERPYLRVGNVQDGHLDLADVSIIELPANVAAGVELRPGDVLMTEGGDLDKLGRGTLWRGEIPGCLHQNHIFAVRCFLHKLKPMFLAYVTAAKYGRDYFEATGKKTTNLACTNATKVGQFPLPLPPLTEQEAICAHLDNKLSEMDALIETIESQITALTGYRKSLIHECVTGQRRITEADLNRVQIHD